ncbi:MAG: signal recognition particle protein Srp19, partial [Acidilobaceae archaeon]
TKNIGSLSKILQYLPGAGLFLNVSKDTLKLGDEKIKKWIAIMDSMTYEELENPEIIDKSRIRRIAIGSGTSVEDVKELLSYYKTIKKLMLRLKKDKSLLRRLGLGNIS